MVHEGNQDAGLPAVLSERDAAAKETCTGPNAALRPPSFFVRLFCFFLDIWLLQILSGYLTVMCITLFVSQEWPVLTPYAVTAKLTSLLVHCLVYFAGIFLPLAMWGQTLGKFAGGFRVVMADGRPLTRQAAFVRTLSGGGIWLLLHAVHPALPGLYVLASGIVLLADKGQARAVHDLFAGTRPVREDPLPDAGEVLRPPSFPARAAGYGFDCLLAFLLSAGVLFPVWMPLREKDRFLSFLDFYENALMLPAIFIPVILIGLSYDFILLAVWGTTPGKLLAGFKVVMKDGGKITVMAAFIRTLAGNGFFCLTILLAYFLPWFSGAVRETADTLWLIVSGIVLICDRRRGRAIHDRIAGTRAVVTEPDGPPPAEGEAHGGSALPCRMEHASAEADRPAKAGGE